MSSPSVGFAPWHRLALPLLLLGFTRGTAQELTVSLGTPPDSGSSAITNTIVAHNDNWRWRRGTNEPQADWRIAADASLDASWNESPGGFGYGDSDIVGEATTISGMLNVHTTLYIRRTFSIATPSPSNTTVLVRADYDDGFVAYLDGVEVARKNVAGAIDSPVPNTATTGGVSHEASCCNAPTNSPSIISLGSANALLTPGDHTLAIIGVNQAPGSSDFHLIVDLLTATPNSSNPPPSMVISYPGYAIATTNFVTLTGSNTFPGSTRVTVNGDDADFLAASGTWSHTVALKPGWNALYVAAQSSGSSMFSSVVQDVIYETGRETLSGTLSENASFTTPGTVIFLDASVSIPANVTLEIGPGTAILGNPGEGITAQAGGRLLIHGTDEARVYMRPFEGTNITWGPVSATGVGSSIEIRFVDAGRTQISSRDGATGLVEDSELHDFDNPSGGTFGRPVLLSSLSSDFRARRIHLYNYYEMLVRDGLIRVEDSLFEHMIGDGLDFDGAAQGSYAKRNTFRHGNLGNVDAVDVGPGVTGGCTNTIIESSLMWDFPFDKGVSIGDNGSSQGILVTNCLIYGCDSGVAIKDSCSAIVANCTLVDNDFGINMRAKFPETPPGIGGLLTNSFNNIVWDNRAFQIWVTNGATVVANFSDIAGTNWPGVGNISADPIFVNPALRDYRLQPGSPCIGTGAGGETMGVHLPVGGLGRPPLQLVATSPTTNSITLTWLDDTENEDGVVVERSEDGTTWSVVALTGPNAITHGDTGLAENTLYAYRVRTTNWAGLSLASNVTKARTRSTITVVGGPVLTDTSWSGSILVESTVTVSAPNTLTILPGTTVRVNNNVNIAASGGGQIVVAGAEDLPVVITRSDTGSSRWGDLSASGADSSVTIQFARISYGRVRASSGASALVEDSELASVTTSGIIGGNGANLFTVRRIYVHDYEDIDLVNTRTIAEESLFERANSDIFELQSSPAGSVLRRCTFRTCLNPNSDGVDMNGCRGVLLDSCLIYDVTDKGVSSGSATSVNDPTSFGLVVSNSLIHHADIGIGIKDAGTAALFGNTIASVTIGISAYAKFTTEGGHITNGFNNVVGAVTEAVRLTNGATAILTYSDLEGSSFPGEGNLSADPLFRDVLARDYRLTANSPGIGAGLNQSDMGAAFPVGAPMAPSHPRIDRIIMTGSGPEIQFWADNARTPTLESAPSLGGPWQTALAVEASSRPQKIRFQDAPSGNRFYRLSVE